ncbi:TOPRIM nucleotidyl transferase/hydrolase domain-containing protein [Agromyces italicus]|uniref:TOPRIM nucleotidyl transferase/hydrolase domain-containing protein n=1 Tax=Agromyces italicus TaxID=279572 RepID=UPI0003B4FA7B|nr:TOPRIM nucleotidyl transferase/hydrolase domain-containing protein [Agromyces italicus]
MRDLVIAEASTVVLVEGESDRLALEALAVRLGADLAAAEVAVVPMHGVTNLHHHLAALAAEAEAAAHGRPRRVLGLFDAAETAYVRRAVDGAGLGSTDAPLGELGFYSCEPDLEGEPIRALGSARVEELLADQGELARFRTFQRQPFQRGRPLDAQLRRFMGTHAGRKARFGSSGSHACGDTMHATIPMATSVACTGAARVRAADRVYRTMK